MKLKKKVLTTTLAASLMLGSISGFPLSSQGFMNKLGLSSTAVEAAAAQSYFDDILVELKKDAQGVAKIKAVSTDIRAALEVETDSYFAAFVTPVMNKINAELGDAPGSNEDMGRALFEIIASLAYPLGDDNGTEVNYWEAAIEQPQLRAFVKRIVTLAGGAPFEEADLKDYIAAFETALANSLNLEALIELFTSDGNMKGALFTLATAAYDAIADTTKLGGIFDDLDITGDDLLDAYKNIAVEFDQGGSGILSLGAALGRAQLDYSQTVTNSGLTLTPKLAYKGFTIPNSLLNWKVVDTGSKISYDSTEKAFKLDSSASSATVTIEARDSVSGQDLLAYRGSLTMNFTGFYGGGGGGGGGGAAPEAPGYVTPVDVEAIVTDARTAIEQAREQMRTASQDDRNILMAQLRTQLEAKIAGMAHVDVSAAVTVDGDNGKATVDAAMLETQIKKMAEEIAKLNAELKSLDRTAAPLKVELTLDFGQSTANNMELTLPKEVLEIAKANGISHIAIQANGAAVAFPVADYDAEVKVNINKQDNKVATDLTDQRLASNVYQFSFAVGGKAVTSFASPIELRLPVSAQALLDKELLSVAKIVNGVIIVYGGQYNEGSNTVNVNRNSLSIYTVIENRVEFKDIASVQAWAGRHIQVVAAKGIINGRGEGEFAPQELVTRAEFAKMIVLAFGLEDSSATHSFTDVQRTDWFNSYVAAAVKAGIVKGRSADSFQPNGTITRAEMATMAARALVITGKANYLMNTSEALGVFTDRDNIHSSMVDSVALAAKLGIVVGENNAFNPNDASTRAQAAVVIYRLLNQ